MEIIKTYQPVLPSVGKGPASPDPKDALYDILLNLNEENCMENMYSDNKIYELIDSLVPLLDMNTWIDGTYTIFQNYTIVVKTMTKKEFNDLPEFCGY